MKKIFARFRQPRREKSMAEIHLDMENAIRNFFLIDIGALIVGIVLFTGYEIGHALGWIK